MARDSYQVSHDFRISAALGLIENVRTVNFTGLRPNMTTSVENDLVNFGPDKYIFPSDSGEDIFAVSDNVADGAGVEIYVSGLGVDGLLQFEVVALNGTTPVQLANQYIRINLAFVSGANECVGNVSITNTGGTVAYALIDPALQQSKAGVYTIPADEQAVAVNLIPTIRKGGGSDVGVVFGVKIRLRGGVFRRVVGFGLQRSGDTCIELENLVPDVLPPLTDIVMTAEPDSAGATGASRVGLILFKTTQVPV